MEGVDSPLMDTRTSMDRGAATLTLTWPTIPGEVSILGKKGKTGQAGENPALVNNLSPRIDMTGREGTKLKPVAAKFPWGECWRPRSVEVREKIK